MLIQVLKETKYYDGKNIGCHKEDAFPSSSWSIYWTVNQTCKYLQNLQVAQLSQIDRAAGWVSYGQKWKTRTERQYLRTLCLYSTTVTYLTSKAIEFGEKRKKFGNAEPKIPGGNSREFVKFWRELRGIYRSFIFFPIFMADYEFSDILLFNLTHCIMCTTHDWLTAFWAKPWVTYLTQLFVFIEFRCTFKYWYRKSLNSVRISQTQIVTCTNENAEINNSNRSLAKVLHSSAWDGRCSKEDVLRGGSVRGTSGDCW